MKIFLLTLVFLASIVQTIVGTVEVAVKTPECVVFASDSRVTDSKTTEIISDTYVKIAQVSKYVMVQMAGTADPGNKNLQTTIDDFQWKHNFTDTSEIHFDSIITLFTAYCESQKVFRVSYDGLLLTFAGADTLGNIQLCSFTPTVTSPTYMNRYDIYFVGITNIIHRMVWGIDTHLKNRLVASFVAHVDSSQADSVSLWVDNIVSDYNIAAVKDVASWSVQDAIDYANLLVKSTILSDRLCSGKYYKGSNRVNPGTGGNILICIATRNGVHWIKEPVLELND